MRPLLYSDFANSGKVKASAPKLRTAEMNLKETVARHPESKHMLNMQYKDYYYDPFDREPHTASRMISNEAST